MNRFYAADRQTALERGLVLAPYGRDGTIAAAILCEAGFAAAACADLTDLVRELGQGAAFALITEEAVGAADLHALSAWIAAQPSWSDLPFIVLTARGGGLERNSAALRLMDILGNVTLLERPFHPTTLTSAARSALRSRRRQYQARTQLEELASQRAALAEGEKRFRTLADNIPVLCWTADPTGWIVWYNQRWYDYTGTTPERMDGWGWQLVHDPETLPTVLERWRASLATGAPFEMVFPIRGADGVLRPFLTRVAPVRDLAGHIQQWFGTNVDISAERAAEATLRESQERLRFALAAGRLGSWELDLKTRELRCSEMCNAIFGHPQDRSLTYSDLLTAVHPGDQAEVRAAIGRAFRGAGEYAIEYRNLWPDQSIHWIEMRGRALHEPDGSARMMGVAQDITGRKEAEAELRRHREHLEERVLERTSELAATLNQLHAEIKDREHAQEALRQAQKMEAIGQLTGGIAHDFNNLLTGIAGNLELLQIRVAQRRVTDLNRYATAALESTTRAAALTHRLLAFARRQTLDPRPTKVNELVAGLQELIRGTMGPSIEIKLVLAPGLWLTRCDANQLENALLNLCINARDAMPGGGRLSVETANAHLDQAYAAAQDIQPGQYVSLSVTDTGTGMPPDVLARAFDPFFTTKPFGQGTGLGLSMVYGFSKQSNGHVCITSEVDQGTTVRLYLPCHYGEATNPHTDAASLAETRRGRSGETVLVVEDEAVVRTLILEVLDNLGYAALEADDGLSGLRILQSGTCVDLLITDIGLPGMNGSQLVDAARAWRPDLRVLFITGYAHDAAIAGGVAEVGMELLGKPFTLDALTAKIRTLIKD